MKKIIWLGLVLITMLAASGCGLSGNSQTSLPRTTPTAAQPAASQNNTNAIIIKNFSFNPATLTIKKDATVAWINNDLAPHQIKSATFNSGVLNKGQIFSFTFSDAGTFNYSCSIHPAMTGEIIVE